MQTINDYIKWLKKAVKAESKDNLAMIPARDVIKMLIEIKGDL